jgi:hypothetical protein
MAKKAKKPRSHKYEEKLSIEGTFDDVIKVSVIPMPKRKIVESRRFERNGESYLSIVYDTGKKALEKFIYKYMGDYWLAYIEFGEQQPAIDALNEYGDPMRVIFTDTPFEI